MKRTKGVTAFAVLYLCCGIPFLLPILLILAGFFQALFQNQVHSEYGNPASLLPLVLINIAFPAIPLYLMIAISVGLFKLSNKARLQTLIFNKIFFVIFLIGIVYVFMLPISQAYKMAAVGSLVAALIFLFASTYYLTRAKVKEQFK